MAADEERLRLHLACDHGADGLIDLDTGHPVGLDDVPLGEDTREAVRDWCTEWSMRDPEAREPAEWVAAGDRLWSRVREELGEDYVLARDAWLDEDGRLIVAWTPHDRARLRREV